MSATPMQEPTMLRRAAKLVAFALLLVSMSGAAQPTSEEPGRDEQVDEPGWTIAVVKLGYADAAEVALLLSQVLPSTVRVVAYEPTNSLIIAGDPKIVAGFGNDRARGDDQHGPSAADGK
jgi:type II secretory pathway component GspD/PulD (secretin)